MSERLVAAPDTVLAGRYRLDRVVATRGATTLWRGRDEVLARPVAVRVLDEPDTRPDVRAAFLAAAVAAGRLTHPRIARTYDAADEHGLTYVVGEWVEGQPLTALLRDGPLPAPRATTVAAQVAEAVAYAHGHGVHHGDLDTGEVLVCADGAVKVTDFAVGAAVRPAATDGVSPEERDTRAVGALLYACLTGRSATGAEPDLPLAPRRDGRLLSPRQVRAGVPRELDAIAVRTLLPELLRHAGPITSPAELVAALAPLPGDGPATLPPDDDEPVRPRRRLLRVGVPLLVVAGVAVAGLLTGLAVGRVPGQARRFPGLVAPTVTSTDPAAPVLIRPVSIRDFDPEGDGQESRSEIPLVTDADTGTAWSTTTYLRSPAFGGLKSGVGLLVDLGAPVAVGKLDLAFAKAGVSAELRAANAAGDGPGDFPVVATVTEAKEQVTMTPKPPTTARYWLIWITRLVPADDGKFSAGIAELAFYR